MIVILSFPVDLEGLCSYLTTKVLCQFCHVGKSSTLSYKYPDIPRSYQCLDLYPFMFHFNITLRKSLNEQQSCSFTWDTKSGFIFSIACLSSFLASLDVTSLSVAQAAIMQDLHADNFAWAISAYAITSVAFIPLFAELAGVCRLYCSIKLICTHCCCRDIRCSPHGR